MSWPLQRTEAGLLLSSGLEALTRPEASADLVFGLVRLDFFTDAGQARVLNGEFWGQEDDSGGFQYGAVSTVNPYFLVTLADGYVFTDPLTDAHKERIFNALFSVRFSWNWTLAARWSDKAAKVTRVSDTVCKIEVDPDTQQDAVYETNSYDYDAIYYSLLSRNNTPGDTDPVVVTSSTTFRSGNALPLLNAQNLAERGESVPAGLIISAPILRTGTLTTYGHVYAFRLQVPDASLDHYTISVTSVSEGQQYYIREHGQSYLTYASYTATASDTTSTVASALAADWNANVAGGVGPPKQLTASANGSDIEFAEVSFFPTEIGVSAGLSLSSTPYSGNAMRNLIESWSGTARLYNEDRSTLWATAALEDIAGYEDPQFPAADMEDSDLDTWLPLGGSPAVHAGWADDASNGQRCTLYFFVQHGTISVPTDGDRGLLLLSIDGH